MKEFKVGDKVWVRTKIIDIEGNSVRVTSELTNGAFWVVSRDCKPVEQDEKPEANAVFIAPGHNRIGTLGTVTPHIGNVFYFESLDGKFMRWCDRNDFEWLGPATHVPVEQAEPDLSYYRRLAWNDTLQKGDIIFSSGTLDFHEPDMNIGIKVEDLFSFARDDFGSTLTFYRPIK